MIKTRNITKKRALKVFSDSVLGKGINDDSGWSMNIRGFKVYAFTLDYYQGKPSWQGSYRNDLTDCFFPGGRAIEKYAIDLRGDVFELIENGEYKFLFNVKK